ncbi:hypothetical protein L6R53_10085 [Myxococcota bacterium]|nr:hypothetical protein [Myxococcota bacterium]
MSGGALVREDLARGLVAGTALLADAAAEPDDLAANLELYARVAAIPRATRAGLGLEVPFQAATRAWMEAGADARSRAFTGLHTDALVELAYTLAHGEEPETETVVGWAAAAVRAALVSPLLEPDDRVKVQDVVGELVGVADSHPQVFLPAAMVASMLAEVEPLDRWPREAAALVGLFSRLPLLAAVDGEL